jgi:hypothetical protein
VFRVVALCHPNTLEYVGIRCSLGVKKPGHEAHRNLVLEIKKEWS